MKSQLTYWIWYFSARFAKISAVDLSKILAFTVKSDAEYPEVCIRLSKYYLYLRASLSFAQSNVSCLILASIYRSNVSGGLFVKSIALFILLF